MTTFKTLLVGAAVGALLAVVGVTAAMAVLNPTAGDVATRMANQATDPNEPPTFYGAR